MPDFQNPAAFLLLLLIPVLYLLRYAGFFSRMSFLITLSDWNGKYFPWEKKPRNFASMFSRICGCIGFVVTVIALADPVLYRQERVYTSRGTDVMFVIDVSPSMAAKDIGGISRLEAAKHAVTELVNDNIGATFGVVAMGEEASIVIPPTVDKKIFHERLSALSLGNLGDGTAIGTGLATAVFHMASSGAPKKCIVLVTDGENNAGAIHPETAAELAAKNNIIVYTLGVGTTGSVPIEYIDPVTNERYTPYCIEPSLGADRVALAFLCEAYDEENISEDPAKPDVRTVLHLHPALAPVKAAVLPLSKKLSDKAGEVFDEPQEGGEFDEVLTRFFGKDWEMV